MSDNPIADILAPYIRDQSEETRRACESRLYDFAKARGCDLGRDVEAYARLRVVTSLVRRGIYGAWMLTSLDALRDAIYSSHSRAEELRRRVDVALRVTQPMYERAEVFVEGRRVDAVNYLASPRERERAEADAYAPSSVMRVESSDGRVIGEARTIGPMLGPFSSGPVRAALTINNAADIDAAFGEGSEIANAFRYARERTSPALATGDDLDRLALTFGERRVPGESDARLRERVLNPMRILGVVRQTDTATQQREADARETWRFRILNGLIPSRMRPCVSCGVESIRILCFACECHDEAASVLARWRNRITQRQRHAEPVPLDVLGGVCASRLYPEAPRAHDAVRLRCPLRRSPDRGVTLCVAQPTTDCVTPTRREA